MVDMSHIKVVDWSPSSTIATTNKNTHHWLHYSSYHPSSESSEEHIYGQRTGWSFCWRVWTCPAYCWDYSRKNMRHGETLTGHSSFLQCCLVYCLKWIEESKHFYSLLPWNRHQNSPEPLIPSLASVPSSLCWVLSLATSRTDSAKPRQLSRP